MPAEWATADTISLFKPVSSINTPSADLSFLCVSKPSNAALIGSRQGGAFVFQPSDGSVNAIVPESEGVTAGLWIGSRVAVGTPHGKVQILENGQQIASFTSHSGSVSGLSLHPSGEILASASTDGTYALYDVEANRPLTQVQASSGMSSTGCARQLLIFVELTCTAFHPDGHLLATGGKNGHVQIFDVKSGAVGGTFGLEGPAKAVCFSENGTWLAVAVEGATVVNIYDLRKVGTLEGLVHTLDIGHTIESLDWDYSAQYLLVGGLENVTVKQFTKATKLWSEPFKAAVPGSGVGWGDSAQSILTAGSAGTVTVFSSP